MENFAPQKHKLIQLAYLTIKLLTVFNLHKTIRLSITTQTAAILNGRTDTYDKRGI